MFARALGCKVVVLEPVPEYVATIQKGLALNPGFAEGVHLHRNVAYDQQGEFTLRVPVGRKQLGMVSMMGTHGALKGYPPSHPHYNVTATAVRADDLLLADSTPICLLKADVEGYEPQAARTALTGWW